MSTSPELPPPSDGHEAPSRFVAFLRKADDVSLVLLLAGCLITVPVLLWSMVVMLAFD
jgi:hypothetical protein